MAAVADVYEVTFQYNALPNSFTVPAKYAYAVVQAVYGLYAPDVNTVTSENSYNVRGQAKFIVKGGRVLKRDEFYIGSNISLNIHLTIIGYLPT